MNRLGSIRAHLQEMARHQRKIGPDEIARMREMRDAGMSAVEIGRVIGCHDQTVRQHVGSFHKAFRKGASK